MYGMRITFLLIPMTMINKRKLHISLFLYYFCSIISLVNSSNNRMMENLKHIVHTAIENDSSDDLLIKQLSQILEEEEGFSIANQSIKHSNSEIFIDGSGDWIEEPPPPPFYANMSIITFTIGTTVATTDLTKYTPRIDPSCRCEKGEKGDPGSCPANCGWRYNKYTRHCLGSRINLERLTQSIRQLIIDTKKIAHRNARTAPCICPASSVPIYPVSNPYFLDYTMLARFKGEKGDVGTSCSSDCLPSGESNIRVFLTLEAAMDAACTYPDHTYVHIVNEHGHLQGVFIRVQGRLIPIRLESEHAIAVPIETLPTALSIPKPKCSKILSCQKLHMFALGPYTRAMCNPKRPNIGCLKLSDYDDLCGRISERYHLQGFYRAFMSTSTQWLGNLFADVCMNAKIVNMHEDELFDTFEEIFDRKIPRNEMLDVQGLRPQFQYWWHGSLPNGTTSRDTCLDWSRQDSSTSGLASRLPNGIYGLFDNQYLWPCSISDSNIGILCIETNCDKRNYYKH